MHFLHNSFRHSIKNSTIENKIFFLTEEFNKVRCSNYHSENTLIIKDLHKHLEKLERSSFNDFLIKRTVS
jgi:hypothetical protein